MDNDIEKQLDKLQAEYLQMSMQFESAKEHIENQKQRIEQLQTGLLNIRMMVNSDNPISHYAYNIVWNFRKFHK